MKTKKSIDEQIKELETKKERKLREDFEKKELPKLKKKYEGKYFKTKQDHWTQNVIYLQVLEVTATYEYPGDLVFTGFTKEGEDYKLIKREDLSNNLIDNSVDFIDSLATPITKEKYDEALEKFLVEMLEDYKISTELSEIPKLKKQLREAKKEAKAWKSSYLKTSDKLEEESIRYFTYLDFVLSNTLITKSRREKLAVQRDLRVQGYYENKGQ